MDNNKAVWSDEELEEIMEKEKIWQPTIGSIEHYNETGEQMLLLQEKIKTDRTDIISALWFAVLSDAMVEFDDSVIFAVGNHCYAEDETMDMEGGWLVSVNNTYEGVDYEVFSINNLGYVVSISDLVFALRTSDKVFFIDEDGASVIAKNLCAYSETGPLTTVYDYEEHDDGDTKVDNLLKADPEFDEFGEPLGPLVRVGGARNVIDDPTTIGAIQTMDTDIIEAAVQAGLTAQGITGARATKLDNLDEAISTRNDVAPDNAGIAAIKERTDNLPDDPAGVSDLASVDTSAVKLAADGLDNVVVAEPSGDSTGWTFVQGLKWLIMRFKNKHTSDNYSGITVHKEDDTISTTQPVTETDGVKAVSIAE
jgi:hypothetical protein